MNSSTRGNYAVAASFEASRPSRRSSFSALRRISVRTIISHKVRLALTVLAVVLGTAFIAGAFMFTAMLSSTFDIAVSSNYQGAQAVAQNVTPDQRLRIAQAPGVTATHIRDTTSVVVADESDNPLQTRGMPTFAVAWPGDSNRIGPQENIMEGEAPRAPDEVAIDAQAAKKFGLSVGQKLTVIDPRVKHDVIISGLSTSDNEQASMGVVRIRVPEEAYLQNYLTAAPIQKLLVTGQGTDQEVVDAVRAIDHQLTVDLASDLTERTTESMKSVLSFINYFLVAFGLVGLLVGTFMIANTFAMIVALRTREFALLRAVGTSSGQLTASVVFEAVLVGLLGSGLGVLGGIGLVILIRWVMNLLGMPIPSATLGITPQAIGIPIVLGVFVTVLSAWMPARKAGSTRPVEAMRSTETATHTPLLTRTAAGIVFLVMGCAVSLWGLWASDWRTSARAELIGLGAVEIIAGFFLAGPALSIPLVPTVGRVIGAPFRAVGKLAATNSRRNPRRTSATAFALTLGVALITLIGMLGATMKASIADLVENNVSADFVLEGPGNGEFPVPADAVGAVREVPGIETIMQVSVAPVTFDPSAPMTVPLRAYDADVSTMYTINVAEGSADLSQPDSFMASRTLAAQRGWKVGSTAPIFSSIGEGSKEVTLIGIFEDDPAFGEAVMSSSALAGLLPPRNQNALAVAIRASEGVDFAQLRSDLETAVKPYLVVQVKSSDEVANQAAQLIDQMLYILYALLALAVVIAILGIVNTLTLNVIERRQEIGMLRAVGAYRRQIRTMITLEAVQVSVFGVFTGILIGLFLGWCFLTVLSTEGLEELTVPWSQLGVMLLGSLGVGVVAALWPAHRAAATAPLEAISGE